MRFTSPYVALIELQSKVPISVSLILSLLKIPYTIRLFISKLLILDVLGARTEPLKRIFSTKGNVQFIAGIFIGDRLSTKIDGNKLKKGFGWFVLLMGIYILAQQLFFQAGSGH